MTSQNQQPQGPSPFDRSSGHPSTNNSSWTTTQTIHTNSSLQQQSPLPEQKVPAWVAPPRPMPAAEYQHDASTAQLTSSPLSLAYELSNPLTASGPGQTFPSKRHRLRTFFILFMLMLSLLVALSAVLGPNLFAKVPGSASNSLPALGASGPFVKAPLNADQINAIMHLSGYMKFKQLASIYVSHMTLD